MNNFNYYLNISEKLDPSMSNLGNEPLNELDDFCERYDYALRYAEQLFKENNLKIGRRFLDYFELKENDKYCDKFNKQLENLFSELYEKDYYADFDSVNDVLNYTELYKNLEQEFRSKLTKENKGKYRNELNKFLTLKLVDKYYAKIFEIYNNIINEMYPPKNESKTVIYYDDILKSIEKILNLFNLKYTKKVDKTEKYIYISLVEKIYDGLAITIRENLIVEMKKLFFENTIDMYKNENDFYEFAIDCYQNDFIIEKIDDKVMYYLNILEQIENFLLLEENKYMFLNNAVDYKTDQDESVACVMCYFSVKDEYYNTSFFKELENNFYQYLLDNNMSIIDKSSVNVTSISSPTIPNEVVIEITDEFMLFNESMGVSTNVQNIAANIYDVVKTKINLQELSMNAMNNLVLTEEEKKQVMGILSSGKYFNIHKILDNFNSYLLLVENESKIYDKLYYAVHTGGMKPLDDHEQTELNNISLNDAVILCKKLAKENKSQVRLSTTKGYNNQGHYFHLQSETNESKIYENVYDSEKRFFTFVQEKVNELYNELVDLKICDFRLKPQYRIGDDYRLYVTQNSSVLRDVLQKHNFKITGVGSVSGNGGNYVDIEYINKTNESSDLSKYYKKADLIYDKVKAKFKKKPYENAGQKEIRDFEDSLPSHLSYQEKNKLMQYINDKIDTIEL